MSRGQRFGYHQEETWLIDIIGDKFVSGSVIREKLSDKGLNFDNNEFDLFLGSKLQNGVISYSYIEEGADSNKYRTYFCLVKEYLRSWKLKELGI
jgi:hypothetical protein